MSFLGVIAALDLVDHLCVETDGLLFDLRFILSITLHCIIHLHMDVFELCFLYLLDLCLLLLEFLCVLFAEVAVFAIKGLKLAGVFQGVRVTD